MQSRLLTSGQMSCVPWRPAACTLCTMCPSSLPHIIPSLLPQAAAAALAEAEATSASFSFSTTTTRTIDNTSTAMPMHHQHHHHHGIATDTPLDTAGRQTGTMGSSGAAAAPGELATGPHMRPGAETDVAFTEEGGTGVGARGIGSGVGGVGGGVGGTMAGAAAAMPAMDGTTDKAVGSSTAQRELDSPAAGIAGGPAHTVGGRSAATDAAARETAALEGVSAGRTATATSDTTSGHRHGTPTISTITFEEAEAEAKAEAAQRSTVRVAGADTTNLAAPAAIREGTAATAATAAIATTPAAAGVTAAPDDVLDLHAAGGSSPSSRSAVGGVLGQGTTGGSPAGRQGVVSDVAGLAGSGSVQREGKGGSTALKAGAVAGAATGGLVGAIRGMFEQSRAVFQEVGEGRYGLGVGRVVVLAVAG